MQYYVIRIDPATGNTAQAIGPLADQEGVERVRGLVLRIDEPHLVVEDYSIFPRDIAIPKIDPEDLEG